MFPLAHAGITLAAWRTLRGRWTPGLAGQPAWILLGSALPDLLDKPVGHLVLGHGNGRLVGHTAALVLTLAGAGYLLSRRGRGAAGDATWALAFGAGAHLALDRVFLDPKTFLWPLLGAGFPAREFTVGTWVDAILGDPAVYVPEALGAAYLVWEAARWARVRPSGGPAEEPSGP